MILERIDFIIITGDHPI